MYTDEQFEELEQKERFLTEEVIIAMLLVLSVTQSELEKELRSFYQMYGKDGVVTYQEARKWVSEKDHRKRLNVLLLLISGAFSSALFSITPKFESLLGDVISKEYDFFNIDLDGKDIDFILAAPWGADDVTWLTRLSDDVDLWGVNVANDIKRSLLRRDTIDDVLSQLNKRFMTLANILIKLVMTESTAVGYLARRSIFKELGVSKYRYYAREDERTCEVCGSLHGLEFPVSSYEIGVNASPMHPWCRCWEVPIME